MCSLFCLFVSKIRVLVKEGLLTFFFHHSIAAIETVLDGEYCKLSFYIDEFAKTHL